MNTSTLLQNQLLATKFYVPVTPGTLISRPRLSALLNESLKYTLTLVSAPAGFGKTTFLSTWVQSLPASTSRPCWLSLDEEDNDPQLFWTGLLSALDRQRPNHFTSLLRELQSPSCPPLKQLLTALINLLAESTQPFVLILDDYHLIIQEQVHTTLAYLIQHLPPQVHIIIATRADPPLPLSMQRARHHMLEVRTEQLRCTTEETKAFFEEVMGIHLPDETIQEATARTEGWLVGLQLLGLSLPGHADPATLLAEISGKQRYILDYLTEVVLQRQPQEVQTFLLSTCILERLTASLCDAVMEQTGSQQMLEQLEQANLFVVSLDSKRQWYRYHALFAEALSHQLERTHADLLPLLHHRASLWYAERDQTTEAILHASHAKQWEWVVDLIERKSLQLLSLAWGPTEHQLVIFQHWLQQLPADIIGSRPRLCLACVNMLLTAAPHSLLYTWLDAAEAKLANSLRTQLPQDATLLISPSQEQQALQNQLGEVIAFRAFLQSYEGEAGPDTLVLCQQALGLLSAENVVVRTFVAYAQMMTLYLSSINDAVAALKCGLQGGELAQEAGLLHLAIGIMGSAGHYLIGAGQLHKAHQLTQQAMALGTTAEGHRLPTTAVARAYHAEVLREWNELDTAHSLAQEAISLGQQVESMGVYPNLVSGYIMLLRTALSRRELDTALSALREFERIGKKMNRPNYFNLRSIFTTIDQVRLWLGCGDLDRATRWAKELDLQERHGTPFACEREEVACVRILLAKQQPDLALQRLEPVLQRATAGQRWGHVIEIRLLQALAYQMDQEDKQALSALSEAIHLAEPEGYIRSFIDEGTPMETLLYRLRRRHLKSGPTPYLDRLLTAFQQESKARTQAQALPEPLSERELQVLQLLAQGISNQEIAQELVIAYETVKRHVSHIFSKLGVSNRIQAIRQARELGLLE